MSIWMGRVGSGQVGLRAGSGSNVDLPWAALPQWPVHNAPVAARRMSLPSSSGATEKIQIKNKLLGLLIK